MPYNKRMKIFFLILAIFAFLSAPSIVYAIIKNEVRVNSNTDGGDTSVKVNINNDVNTSGSTQESSQTNVNIHQSGEGTAQVKVDGKEYSLEGPGDLSVNENSGSSSSNSPSATPTPTLTAPNPSPTPTNTPSIESIRSVTSPKLIIERIINRWENITEYIQDLVNKITHII